MLDFISYLNPVSASFMDMLFLLAIFSAINSSCIYQYVCSWTINDDWLTVYFNNRLSILLNIEFLIKELVSLSG